MSKQENKFTFGGGIQTFLPAESYAPFSMRFFGNNRIAVGEINIDEGAVSFSGNAHESANVLIENVVKQWSQQWASKLKIISELQSRAESAEQRNYELTDALKQMVQAHKSSFRAGYERIIDLGGDCDSPEAMIAGNPDILLAEKVLAAGITLQIQGGE